MAFTILLALWTVFLVPSVGWTERSLEVQRIKTLEMKELGRYLADQTGEPLYVFSRDQQGKDGKTPKSECFDTCARTWPPISGTPKVDAGVDGALLTSFERKDGQRQLAYNGWPIYYYSVDIGGGSIPSGQAKISDGGTWYLIRPDGTPVPEKEQD